MIVSSKRIKVFLKLSKLVVITGIFFLMYN